jgi:spore coat polysaccharide biosynthesis predicted glycosyltransferase SpsG
VELKKLVTELDEFNLNYKENKKIALKEESFSKLIKFQQENSSKFSSIIIMINEK